MATITKTIDSRIINCLKVLNDHEKRAVLTVAETFAKESKKSKDFWDELSKEQKTAVNRAIKEAEEGKLTSHTEVMKKLRR
jgi:hypothetical protein